MIYDAILFGNGLTLCYQNKIKTKIPPEYSHDLFIDDFVNAIIDGHLTKREESNLHKLFKDGFIYSYDHVFNDFSKFRKEYNLNYEWTWGKLLTSPDDYAKYKTIMDCMPVIYNYWYSNLLSLIENKLNITYTKINFSNSLRSYLSNNSHVFTTNFDGFFDSLNPQHIHGHFVDDCSYYRDLIWYKISQDRFYYPFIWAPAEVGKMHMIEKFKHIPDHDKYYNFSFFHNPIKSKKFLIFGMSFAKAGYMEGMEEYDDKYKKYSFGSCIDDHIINRLKILQDQGSIISISFAYHSESDKKHYEKIIKDFKLENASVFPSSCFNLRVE